MKPTLCLEQLLEEPQISMPTIAANAVPPSIHAPTYAPGQVNSKAWENEDGLQVHAPHHAPVCGEQERRISTEQSNDDVHSTLHLLSSEELPQKNTFIHFKKPLWSPESRPATPSTSAPGSLLKRLFKCTASEETCHLDASQSVPPQLEIIKSQSETSTVGGCDEDVTATNTPTSCESMAHPSTPTSTQGSPIDDETPGKNTLTHFGMSSLSREDIAGPQLVEVDDPPQKNTFIHFNIPKSPLGPDASPPTTSAPGVLLHRLFKTCQSADPPAADVLVGDGLKQGALRCSDENIAPDLVTQSSCGSIASTSAPSTSTRSISGHTENSTNSDSSPTPEQVHGNGNCMPCNYFLYKVDGCRQGDKCTFCHLCPKGEIKKRKKEKLRDLKAAGLVTHRIRIR